MIALHHHTPVETVLIRRVTRHDHGHAPVMVRCYPRGYSFDRKPVCLVTTQDAVTTYYRYSRLHGVWEFKAVGGVV